jgi:hypothetical protein
MLGFGIDLAGYTTGKTSLAVVEIEDHFVNAILLRGSAFSKKRESSNPLEEVVAEEVAVLRRCLAIGPVAVDIPIDLQGLPNPESPQTIWALTRRPIDKALNAMPPFADRIGAPVARFAAIMRAGSFHGLLGKSLFEAYPAATLRGLDIESRYKGKKGADALISLCKTLKIEPHLKNDDDIDAIICALTAAAPAALLRDFSALKIQGPMPTGFRVPKSLTFEKIEVMESDFTAWMRSQEVLT